MQKKTNRLDDVISNPLQAIFYALQSFDVPWKSLNINISLDSDYCICHSGKKITSPLVDFFINSETGKIDSVSMTMLANVIYTKYGVKWDKQWETMYFEYDPISNYDMVEVMEDDETVHEFGHLTTINDTVNTTDSLTTSKTTNTTNESEVGKTTNTTKENEITDSVEGSRENKKAGFNSSDYQKDTQELTEESRTQSTDESGTITESGTTDESGTTTESGTNSATGTNTESGTNRESGSNTDTRNYRLTRSGNIGVTTSQQMIESERNLWMWNFFDSVVYPDIDRVLTINMY